MQTLFIQLIKVLSAGLQLQKSLLKFLLTLIIFLLNTLFLEITFGKAFILSF